MPDRYREREIARLRTAMERRLHSPRLQMALIVASAGAAGFFASVALLHLGLTALWLRYPMAAAAGYATFLLLLCAGFVCRGTTCSRISTPQSLVPIYAFRAAMWFRKMSGPRAAVGPVGAEPRPRLARIAEGRVLST
jgi:hypothetical protein